MNKSKLILLVIAFIVAVFCGVKFRDWFATKPIQISCRLLPAATAGGSAPLVFLLDRKYQITTVKVVLDRDARTNKHPVPLWELVSASNSIPVTHLIYGTDIAGMKPRYAGVPAVALAPSEEYRVEIVAGKLHGQRTFTVRPQWK